MAHFFVCLVPHSAEHGGLSVELIWKRYLSSTQTEHEERVRCDWRIPDELWERIEPLFPPGKPHPLGCYNPRVSDRAAMDVILSSSSTFAPDASGTRSTRPGSARPPRRIGASRSERKPGCS
jgi:hypothetical protein